LLFQIPSHLLERLTLAKGNGTAALTAEEAEGSAEDGAWIIQCPKDVHNIIIIIVKCICET